MADHEPTIQQFPDHILLLVFGYLDTVSVVRSSRVCCAWYNVSRDASLGKTLDLRLLPLKLKQLRSVCQRKITPTTTAVHLRGATYANAATMDKLTICFLEMLRAKVPHMRELTLENFDLRDIPVTELPSNLRSLSLYKSMLTLGWFDPLKFQNFFVKLKTLNLHSCSKISNSDLEALSYLHTLTDLNLANCFRISARGIPGLKKNLNRLTHVDFSGCPGVNNVVLYYFSSLPLQYLKLRFCHLITDQGVKNLFLQFVGTTLRWLDLYSCHEVTDQTLDLIADSGKNLLHLDIGACGHLTEQRVDKLREELPDCVILFDIPSPSEQSNGGQGVEGCQMARRCKSSCHADEDENIGRHGAGWS